VVDQEADEETFKNRLKMLGDNKDEQLVLACKIEYRKIGGPYPLLKLFNMKLLDVRLLSHYNSSIQHK